MRRKDFEKLVEEGFERLPQWVREKIRNVALLVESEPSEQDRKAQGLHEDETLLGLYKGIPLSERGEHYGIGHTMPDTITLYQHSIEDAAAEDLHIDLRSRYGGRYDDGLFRERIAQVVAETIWHEYAHHFGMNEHEVQLRERKRDGMVE